MSDTEPARPSQVTLAGWVVIVASTVVVLTSFDRMGSVRSIETREEVTEFLTRSPGSGLGLSVDGALDLLRLLSMVAAACAAAAIVLGWHVLRRHRPSRVALSVVAVPLFLTGIATGGFFSSLVAVSAALLWMRPARDWFDGRRRGPDPFTRQAGPSAARAGDVPGPPPTVPTSPPDHGPAPYAGFGAPTASPAASPTASPTTSPTASPAAPPSAGSSALRRPGSGQRPMSVVWACSTTWAFSLLVSVMTLASAVLVVGDPGLVLDEVRRQNPDLESQGVTEPMLLAVLVAVLAGLVLWALTASVVAWFVWRGRDWARITLIVSASVTVGLGVVAAFLTLVALPLVLAAALVMRLLVLRPSVEWCRHVPPPAVGPGQG